MKRFLVGFLAAYLLLAPVVHADDYDAQGHCIPFRQALTYETVAVDGLIPGDWYGAWWVAEDPSGTPVYNGSFGAVRANDQGIQVWYVDRYLPAGTSPTYLDLGYRHELYIWHQDDGDWHPELAYYEHGLECSWTV
jgi:hypothetical protein